MIDFLYSLDVTLFFFINQSMANPVFDWLMPIITDLNHNFIARIVVLMWIGLIIWKGGSQGRITIGVLIVAIIISDQFNSAFMKDLFGRVRPCKSLEGVRLLVDCGGGLSFPSSHAVNNFTGAAVISHFYKKQAKYWYVFAALVAFTRPYVGVHYPSDIVAGGLIGFGIGHSATFIWEHIKAYYQNRNSKE
ncbi:MAG: phosphatase PAP2 family protein [Bacteroidota bacterium]